MDHTQHLPDKLLFTKDPPINVETYEIYYGYDGDREIDFAR